MYFVEKNRSKGQISSHSHQVNLDQESNLVAFFFFWSRKMGMAAEWLWMSGLRVLVK